MSVSSTTIFQQMVELRSGDLFTAHVDVLVNPTNARGVSGAGLALEFKRRFPIMAKEYADFCQQWQSETGQWPTGRCYLWDVFKAKQPPKAVACFPTKDDWRRPSKLTWIEQGLKSLIFQMQERGLRSVALPALGCGLGGLLLGDVKPLIDRAFFGLDLEVIVFANKNEAPIFGGNGTRQAVERAEFRGPVRPVLQLKS